MRTNDRGTKVVRPNISAMERGPGPARYVLPTLTGGLSHDTTKKLYPIYSFGRSLGTSFFKKDFGPGPAHAIDPSITRCGADGAPHYSLAFRQKDLTPFNTPGPGTYAPEGNSTCFQGEKQLPSYSMGARTRFRRRDSVPSPNSYSLPSMIGPRIPHRASSACYSMLGRASYGGFDTDNAKTPGPARYGTVTPDLYQKKSPTYSILSRNYMPGDGTKTPGPGAHCLENVHITKHKSPSFSLGIKHSEYMCPLITDTTN